MNFTIDESQFERDLMQVAKDVTHPVEAAMAGIFETCVRANFGAFGFERAREWAPLSNRSEAGRRYIALTGRSYATLEFTGAMKSNLRVDGNEVILEANANAPYALDHETGIPSKHLPPRPVFPMWNGECLPKTYGLVVDAAQNELNRQL